MYKLGQFAIRPNNKVHNDNDAGYEVELRNGSTIETIEDLEDFAVLTEEVLIPLNKIKSLVDGQKISK